MLSKEGVGLFFLVGLSLGLGQEYVPGTTGATWSRHEIDIVRKKVLDLIDQDVDKKKTIFNDFFKRREQSITRPISEMALFRLAFHDCHGYKAGLFVSTDFKASSLRLQQYF